MRSFTKYRMTLSDGSKIVVESDSAATAVGKALRLYPMRTVAECHSGYTKEEANLEGKLRGEKIMAGMIPYEIPHHEAMPMQQQGMSGSITSLANKTMSMFDDSKLRSASKSAMEKFGHA